MTEAGCVYLISCSETDTVKQNLTTILEKLSADDIEKSTSMYTNCCHAKWVPELKIRGSIW